MYPSFPESLRAPNLSRLPKNIAQRIIFRSYFELEKKNKETWIGSERFLPSLDMNMLSFSQGVLWSKGTAPHPSRNAHAGTPNMCSMLTWLNVVPQSILA